MSPSSITAAKHQGQQNLAESPQVWLLPFLQLVDVCVCVICGSYLAVTLLKYQCHHHSPHLFSILSFFYLYLFKCFHRCLEEGGGSEVILGFSYFSCWCTSWIDYWNCVWLGVLVPLPEKSQCWCRQTATWLRTCMNVSRLYGID